MTQILCGQYCDNIGQPYCVGQPTSAVLESHAGLSLYFSTGL